MRIKTKDIVAKLPVYQPGLSAEDVKREYGIEKVVKLASNENPYGCSVQVKQALEAEMSKLSLYPDGASLKLKQAVAEQLQVSSEQLIFGAGSDDIILMICRAFLTVNDESIVADQTFPQYKHNADIEGARTIEVPLKEGKHDLEGMLAAITDRTKIVWICNPNNPTGTIVTKEELITFMSQVPTHVLVALDEAYCEYVTDASYPNSLELIAKYPNLVALRTFSKIHGLASLRLGYGIGQPEVIRSINQVREPFNTSRFAQAAGIAAIQDQEYVSQCKQWNAEGLRYLQEQCERLELRTMPAHGNFIMIEVPTLGKVMFEQLVSKGIIVRAGFRHYPNAIRVTVGSREQNEAFIQAIEQILSECKVDL
nr:histidinol-phosphate transaminase [Paenibacillus assamensis]